MQQRVTTYLRKPRHIQVILVVINEACSFCTSEKDKTILYHVYVNYFF